MKISGFQPFTLSDYPGLTAAIIFTQGCNFRCPFCHNGSLLPMQTLSADLIETNIVLRLLDERKKVLEGLVITGGEPTLQRDLDSFIRQVRNLGYKIKLDTNGSNPDVIESLLNRGLLNYIAMDIKAPLNKYDELSAVTVNKSDICKSLNVISQSGVSAEFRTTYVPELLTERDLADIKAALPDNVLYKVQPFISEKALDKNLRNKHEIINR